MEIMYNINSILLVTMLFVAILLFYELGFRIESRFKRANIANGINSGGLYELEVYSTWLSIDLNKKNIDGCLMNTFSLGLNW